MANKYAGTQTEKNLREAFSGESQARNKYTYFASKAKKEGFEQNSSYRLWKEAHRDSCERYVATDCKRVDNCTHA